MQAAVVEGVPVARGGARRVHVDLHAAGDHARVRGRKLQLIDAQFLAQRALQQLDLVRVHIRDAEAQHLALPFELVEGGGDFLRPHERVGTVQQQENVGMAMDIIDEVQKRMENSMNSMKEQLKGIVNVLTPEQQVESLLFIQKVLQEPRSQESIFNTLKKRIDVQENESSSTPEEEEEEEGN